MISSRWLVEIRRLFKWASEPTIVGATFGLILSWNSTSLLLACLYGVSGLNCILAYLTTTWFPPKEHTPFRWVRSLYLRAIGFAARKFSQNS
jgi:hypothetical protein